MSKEKFVPFEDWKDEKQVEGYKPEQNLEVSAKKKKIDIEGVAVESLRAGMTVEQTLNFMESILGEKPSKEIIEKIKERRSAIQRLRSPYSKDKE